jgi:hypothetical protein
LPALTPPVLDQGYAYWLEQSKARVVLRRSSASGATPRDLVSISHRPDDRTFWRLLVSDGGVALVQIIPQDLHGGTAYQVDYGVASQPLTRLRYSEAEDGPFATGPFISRDEIAYVRGNPATLEATAFDGGRRSLALQTQSRVVAVAGGRIAIVDGDRLTVRDAHTGASLRTLTVPAVAQPRYGVGAVRLTIDAEGWLLARVDLYTAPASDPPVALLAASPTDTALRALPYGTRDAVLAAGMLAYAGVVPGGERIVVRDLEHGDRVVFRGPPSREVTPSSVDQRRVAWATPSCDVVADYRDVTVKRLPRGPCTRTEVSLRIADPDNAFEADRVRYRVQCLASDAGDCHLRFTLQLSGSREFAFGRPLRLPVGRGRTIRAHVAPVVARCARELGAVIRVFSTKRRRGRDSDDTGVVGEPSESLAHISPHRWVTDCQAARRHLGKHAARRCAPRLYARRTRPFT